MFPGSVLDTLSSTIRAVLLAPFEELWCVADLSSIESVGAAWLAGCDKMLDIFFAGRDMYKSFAVEAEGIEYDAVTKKMRTHYKPRAWAHMYQLSGGGLVAYAESMGVPLEEEEADRQIALFREIYHEIPHLWRQLDNAAIAAIEHPGQHFSAYPVDRVVSTYIGRNGKEYKEYAYKPTPCATYHYDGTFLFCKLPSGRYLCYYDPSIEEVTDSSEKGRPFHDAQCVVYGH